MSDARTLWLPGRPIAFARPAQREDDRGRRYGSTPKRYREWRETAEGWVALQTRRPIEEPTTAVITVHGNGIVVTLGGEVHAPERPAVERGHLTGDLDNYAKAALDALEHGGALANDQLVHALTMAFDPIPYDEPRRLTR